MVQSLQVVILLLSVTLLAVIVVFLARRNRFWKMVRRSMRAKIDLIYDMRAQYAELSDHARESIPRMTRIGDTLEALAARKDLPPECRVQVDRALVEMKELDRNLPRIRATLQIPEEELATETQDATAQEDREFTDRLYAIFQERMADEKFNIGVLATQMGMSRSQLFKRVREVTGESPKQLLNKIRLQSAERMLQEGNMTVSEVADATGWNSVSYSRNPSSAASAAVRRRNKLFPDKTPVTGELLAEGVFAHGRVRVEDFHLGLAAGRGPVAHDLAVQQHHRPEDAAVVVGVVAMVRVDGDVAALVADQVFVVGWKEGDGAAAESARAAVPVTPESEPAPAVPDEFVAEGVHAAAAVADAQAAPPDEVLEGGGAVAAEVFARQQGQGFLPREGTALREFVGCQGVTVLHREKVAAAQEPHVLGQADVVGQAVVIHRDAPVREGGGETGLLRDAVA